MILAGVIWLPLKVSKSGAHAMSDCCGEKADANMLPFFA